MYSTIEKTSRFCGNPINEILFTIAKFKETQKILLVYENCFSTNVAKIPLSNLKK